MKHIVKMNLPKNERQFLAGQGEGVFVIIDEETAKVYNDDTAFGGEYFGILDTAQILILLGQIDIQSVP